MNATIQCLSNVPELTDYFLSSGWQNDINKDNLMGTQGKVAISYAQLIQQMWSGARSCITPRVRK